MGLKEALVRFGEKRKKIKEYEDELRMRKTAEERMKTAQERDLEGFMEEARQKRIKKKVSEFKQKKMKEFWSSPYKQRLPMQKDGCSMQSNFLTGGMYLR